MLSIARDLNGETRFVIYKDGPIRSSEELRDILNAFRDIAKQFRFKVVDVIGLLRDRTLEYSNCLRIERGVKVRNPEVGLWTEI